VCQLSDQSTSIKFTLSGAPKAWNEEAGELLGEWAEGIEAVFINSTESGEDFVTVDEIAWGGNEYSTRYYTKGGSLSVDGMEQKFAALFGDEFVKDGQLNLAEFAAKKGYGLDLEFEVSCAYEDQRDRERIEVEQGQIKRFVRDWVLAAS